MANRALVVKYADFSEVALAQVTIRDTSEIFEVTNPQVSSLVETKFNLISGDDALTNWILFCDYDSSIATTRTTFFRQTTSSDNPYYFIFTDPNSSTLACFFNGRTIRVARVGKIAIKRRGNALAYTTDGSTWTSLPDASGLGAPTRNLSYARHGSDSAEFTLKLFLNPSEDISGLFA